MRYIFTLLFVCAAFVSMPFITQAALTSSAAMSGYAWSPNIGWVQFDTGSDPVVINPSGRITGFAWSPNVGWIQFGGIAGCPSGTGTCAAEIDFTTNQVSGWARALANGSGWDGWISLSGANHSSSYYGITLENATARPVTFTNFSYAWGDRVVGWTNFSSVEVDTPCLATAVCSADLQSIEHEDVWCEPSVEACLPGYECNPLTVACESPGNFISATPQVVRPGDVVTIEWATDPANGYTACSVEGNGENWSGLSGTESSTIGDTAALYRLTCDSNEIERVMVEVIPVIEES